MLELLSARLDEHEAFLRGLVDETDDITLAEMQVRLRDERGVTVGITTLWRFFDARGPTVKKRAFTPRSRTVRMS